MKDPPSSASTGVVDPNVELILTDPHGFALLGLWTSPRVRFPCTPRAGETPAWAVTWRQTAKTSSPEAQIFVNMIILLGERDLARRWRKDLKEVGSKSGYYQKVDWKEKNGRKWKKMEPVPGQGTTRICSGEEREVDLNGPRHECLYYILLW